MAKFKQKYKAQKLRKSGKSMRQIANHLHVSKGSVSRWCKGIKLTEKQSMLLYLNANKKGQKGRLLGALMNKNKKILAIMESNRWAQS